VDGNIFDSKGVHVGVVRGNAIFGLKRQKLYDLKGSNIYKEDVPIAVELRRADVAGMNVTRPS
jgi:hypothetical protein